MITAYLQHEHYIQSLEINTNNVNLLTEALWIDMLAPTQEEEKMIEGILNIEIPTKREMQEIEPSDRLYKEDSAIFMTSTMLAKSDSPEPKTDAVTFILTNDTLITVRYIELHSFSLYATRLKKLHKKKFHMEEFYIGLLEATVDRMADVLENIAHSLDNLSQEIFRPQMTNHSEHNFKKMLQEIGANADLGGKLRECLVSFNRMVSYYRQIGPKLSEESNSRIQVVITDIAALTDHTNFISNKVGILMSATLGMVNVEQNDIIKIFSVAAVIFLPPTLIASIYGMNFKIIPELNWYFGYPFAILLMILSGWLPYRYFKKKKWL